MEENVDLRLKLSQDELVRISPLTLAYLGDTVYESYIREYLIKKNIFFKINNLHKLAIRYVKAGSQARAIKGIEDLLAPDELSVFKRARNHKKATSAKNASMIDYKHSTGFEALVGYLYLKGDKDRLDYIIAQSIRVIESEPGPAHKFR
ncbi:Mini-ribonuclease 3 [Peptostreptococcus sp. MV1]|uniref:Mini-ribonuclease 3 n=1 Tax=Peptostreptococcus sp. MV1 TaxID=1219626 RepID=UPI00050F4AE5|nr:ribonuclease III domain-containing protein [Peptostreptococcus sp. MV1]KGF13125.1 Mini-ribonuclease 3 [Peptostreptococcus sp. MV1]